MEGRVAGLALGYQRGASADERCGGGGVPAGGGEVERRRALLGERARMGFALVREEQACHLLVSLLRRRMQRRGARPGGLDVGARTVREQCRHDALDAFCARDVQWREPGVRAGVAQPGVEVEDLERFAVQQQHHRLLAAAEHGAQEVVLLLRAEHGVDLLHMYIYAQSAASALESGLCMFG